MSKASDGVAFLIMASFWALNYPFVKFGLAYEPPLFLLLFRILFAALFSFIFMFRSLKFPRSLATNFYIAVSGIFNVAIFMGLWFTGETYESAALSSILIYSFPIIVIVLSSIFLKEKLTAFRILGTVIGFIGVILIFVNQIVIKPNIGLVLLIFGATAWASGAIIFKKFLSGENVVTVNTLQFIYSLPVIAVWAFTTSKFSVSGFTFSFVAIALYIGSLGTSVAYLIYLYLFRKYTVSSISALFFTVPALSIVFSFFLLGEKNSAYTYAGFVLISAGIYLSSRRKPILWKRSAFRNAKNDKNK